MGEGEKIFTSSGRKVAAGTWFLSVHMCACTIASFLLNLDRPEHEYKNDILILALTFVSLQLMLCPAFCRHAWRKSASQKVLENEKPFYGINFPV